MLMKMYGDTIPSEQLKEILKIEIDLWKRKRVSERTGGPPAACPATSTNRHTPAIVTSRPIPPRNQYSTVRPATSNAATSTSRFVPNSNAPSTSRNTQPSSRYTSNSTSTSSLVASSDANSIYRPVPYGKQCPVCTLINDVGVNRCNACNTNLATQTNRPTSANKAITATKTSLKIPISRPTSTSNAVTAASRPVPASNANPTNRPVPASNNTIPTSRPPSTSNAVTAASRPVPASNANPPNGHVPGMTFTKTLLPRSNANPPNRPVPASNNTIIPTSRPPSTSNAVTVASRPVPASNANPPNGHVPGMTFTKTLLPRSNANPPNRPVTASNNKIPTSRLTSTSNAVTAASRPVSASNANPPNRPASNAVKASDPTISSNNLPSKSGITARKES